MNIYKSFFVLLLCSLFLVSCANMETVNSAPSKSGVMKTYQQDYELIKAAVLASMQSMNINIKETKETDEGDFVIAFTKSLSAFSWGEVGRVLVTRNGESGAKVYVHSARRLSNNITAASAGDFARSIFSGVDRILVDKK